MPQASLGKSSSKQPRYSDRPRRFSTTSWATVQSVVKGGPGQAGWGAAETNAVNSQILNNAAVSARNEKSAVGNDVAAIGGGNTVNPSGLETAVNLQTAQSVENAKSQQEEQATVANYQQGNQNYNEAVNEEMQLPKVFDASSGADKAATDANDCRYYSPDRGILRQQLVAAATRRCHRRRRPSGRSGLGKA